MQGIKDIFTFCIGFGTIALCVILVVSGVLRWLAARTTRARRLDILAWIVAAVLFAASLLYFTWGPGGNDNTKTATFLTASSKLFVIFALGVIAASAAVLLVVIVIYLYNIFRVITHTGNRTYIRDSRLDVFIQILRSPAVILAVALGIMALFLLFPLLAGTMSEKTISEEALSEEATFEEVASEEAASEADGLIGIWENGLLTIGLILGNDESQNPSDAFITYALIYIIVLGVGLAVVKILYSIITQSFKKKTGKNLIEEYSNSIGLLAVGVAALWTLKAGEFAEKTPFGIAFELLKSFTAVAAITAFVILILEVIRLLMDMKKPFIRQEGWCLFIVLVGECTIVLMNLVFVFCGALNNAIGIKEDTKFTEFEEKVRQKLVDLMEEQLDTKDESPAYEQPDNNNHERVFDAFDQETTRK